MYYHPHVFVIYNIGPMRKYVQNCKCNNCIIRQENDGNTSIIAQNPIYICTSYNLYRFSLKL